MKDCTCCNISEQENMDVAQLMSMAARNKTLDAETSAIMRRGASLLKVTTWLCSMLMRSRGQRVQHE